MFCDLRMWSHPIENSVWFDEGFRVLYLLLSFVRGFLRLLSRDRDIPLLACV
jgi:hypothetical protein